MGMNDIEVTGWGAPAATGQTAPTGAPLGLEPNAPHGDEFLKTLEPGMALTVKSIAEGRSPYPQGFLMKTPFGQRLTTFTQQYDPTFDAGAYGARAAQRKNYMGGGKQYQELQAIGTVAGHLDDFRKAADALDNTSYPWINSAVNFARVATGDPRVDKFNTVKQAVSNELSKAYRGGHVTEGDVKSWQDNINAAKSPEQLRGVIGQLNDLLMSKRNTLEEGYKQTMGPAQLPEEFSSVNARTKAIFDNIAKWSHGETTTPPVQGTAPTAGAPRLAPGQSTTIGGVTIRRVN